MLGTTCEYGKASVSACVPEWLQGMELYLYL